jgi:hypothetical protein
MPGFLFAVRAHVNAAAARITLATLHLGLKPRHFDIAGILRHVNDRLVAAGIVVTERDQMLHALCWRMLPSVIGGPGGWIAERRNKPGMLVS